VAYVEIRPVRVADLLLREGHPLAARLTTTGPEPSASAWTNRRTLGVASGAMLVLGTVVAGALGLGGGPADPPRSAGEPLGVVPHGGAPDRQRPAEAPVAPEAVTPRFTNAASTGDLVRPAAAAPAPARVAAPVAVAPPAPPAAPRIAPPPAPPAAAPAAAAAPAPGLVESVAAPVAGSVSPTLADVVAPVTGVVDDALQPALSLIGGLLGR
jgi:hypothetical protein